MSTVAIGSDRSASCGRDCPPAWPCRAGWTRWRAAARTHSLDDLLRRGRTGRHPAQRRGGRPGPGRPPADRRAAAGSGHRAGVLRGRAGLQRLRRIPSWPPRWPTGNRAYEEKFGRIFLIRAAGRSRPEILAELQRRLLLDPEAEVKVVAAELRDIALLRIPQLFGHLDRHSGLRRERGRASDRPPQPGHHPRARRDVRPAGRRGRGHLGAAGRRPAGSRSPPARPTPTGGSPTSGRPTSTPGSTG